MKTMDVIVSTIVAFVSLMPARGVEEDVAGRGSDTAKSQDTSTTRLRSHLPMPNTIRPELVNHRVNPEAAIRAALGRQ